MGRDPKLIEALRVIKAKLEATPEPLRGPFLVKGLAPYTPPAHPMSNPVSDDLVQRLRERSVFMRQAGHNDDADMDLEAAAQLAALSAANKALMDERASIIATKREQIDLLNSRATAAEAQLKAAREALTEALAFITNIDNAHKSVRMIRAALNPKAPSESRSLIEQAFRDGLAYGSNVGNADPDLAWKQSRLNPERQEGH